MPLFLAPGDDRSTPLDGESPAVLNAADAREHHRQEVIRTAALGDWVEAISETFVALKISPADSDLFAGTVHTRRFAHLLAADVLATPQSFHRTTQLADRYPLDLMQIGMVVAGEGQLVQDGRTCTLRPGDFAIYETSRPFTWNLRPEWHLRVFTWPRSAVALTEGESQKLTARTVRSNSAVGQLLSPMLAGLLAVEKEPSSAGAMRLADGIADLAVTAAQEEAEPDDPDAAARELYTNMLRYIERNLDDPDLSPQRIAHAFFVSTRTVHRVFARFGNTVAATIRAHRLEVCREAILSPRNASRSLTDVAAEFGFIDLSVFSRAFATRYGVSPSKYRDLRR
ncbi:MULTISPECIES: helix-turn-helix domain-containing protein [unclassified Rhodococcus (in: high G+C Gram-positive bacteria)]|uniref:helix-turn-helix domain-containing protein n=1 Tax=unclassified Rhodococcus (in: high G+C Gram-positive bacteria) TaxID=192944 RepID=UPI00163A8B53|nr:MULTISPECIES: helix-turn-helix domain-containing protein [unclassified Rhodococcus (in: high G+C Gram-positive bacteria)]MBC2640560.1 helix-turn-helix domain-containing protein [Rhodococcus sp. 3A]MBC2894694.1 helix-turn-helix domain-containing protein [Rhodococcus sp. 4CII]